MPPHSYVMHAQRTAQPAPMQQYVTTHDLW